MQKKFNITLSSTIKKNRVLLNISDMIMYLAQKRNEIQQARR